MDFAKFVSLISKRQLFLSNLEVLATTDPHEGMLSQPNYRHRQWNTIADLTPEEHSTMFYKEMAGEERRIQFVCQKNSREFWARRRFYDRRTLLINCWHLNKFESAAMWAQYAAGGQGIAITSNFARLLESLRNSPQRTFLGLVKYLDWSGEAVDSSFGLPFSKRESFSYEKELRLVYWDLEVQEHVNAICGKLTSHMMDHLYRRISTEINWDMVEEEAARVPFKSGLYIPVDLETLVDEVYVSPTSAGWFHEVVQSVCELYGFPRIPVRSDLLSSPLR